MNILLGLALLLVTLTSSATEVPGTVFLEDLTWTEARDAIVSGTTTVIIPTGGTEQNGPHITLGKHNSRMRVASERIARALGNTLVAPVMAYVPEGEIDPPTGHMTKAGTISIPPDVFYSLVEYTARSLRAHGFKDILLLGDSGPNQRVLAEVSDALNEQWSGEDTKVHFVSAWYSSVARFNSEVLVPRGETQDTIGFHAGITDTALSMAMAPQDVRISSIKAGRGTAEDGVSGEPDKASREIGMEAYNFLFEAAMSQIQEFMAEE